MASGTLALRLDPARFFPAQGKARDLAIELYKIAAAMPIISPHGHTDPAWFAGDAPFSNPAELLITPDHYILRMLYSQGISMADMGRAAPGETCSADPRKVWRIFAENYHLFRATPVQIWFNHVLAEIFGIETRLCAETADQHYDAIAEALASDAYRPRALLDRFNVAYISTTEGALDGLEHHARIRADGLNRRITTTFRPDDVVDPDREDFNDNLARLGALTGEDCTSWSGYLAAIRNRRAFFRDHGASATDHGHPTAMTADLDRGQCQTLLDKCLSGKADAEERELFRAQMLTEMAGMSCEDGMVMQLHPGCYRNHNRMILDNFGRDMGADIPLRTSYTEPMRALLNKYGNEPGFSLILFTLDESNYTRELAPLAAHYPCLKLGPAWWFHDSLQGMIRYRYQVTETAGLYNTAGFNDDTRALLSIPARHDLARRVDCRFLAEQVCDGVLFEDEAFELISELTNGLAAQAYKLDVHQGLLT